MAFRQNQLAFFYLLVFIIFIWPYGWPIDPLQFLGAWRFPLATAAIIIIGFVFAGTHAMRLLGFPWKASQIVACTIVAAISFSIFYYLIDSALSLGGFERLFYTDTQAGYFGRFYFISRPLWSICQPLNEEIILRALLLGFFAKIFKHRAYLAILASLVFSFLHLLLYYAGGMNTTLELTTLLTLFFFALAANSLYLKFNHIGFGYVIHLAWNWSRFSSDILKDGVLLNEAQTFNALEGSWPVFTFVLVVTLICLIGLLVHDRKTKRALQ